MTSRPSARLGLAAAGAVALLLAGCGASVLPGTPSAVGQSPATPAADAAGTAAGAGPAAAAGPAPDVCSFFTADEVKKLIGSSPAGKASTSSGGGAGCTWEDTDTYYSLTVDVGDPDTAINGTLPKWDPALGPERTLPGGMRDVAGAVEFVCGSTRDCSVQVARAIQGDTDQQTAIGLVEKIRSKVGG